MNNVVVGSILSNLVILRANDAIVGLESQLLTVTWSVFSGIVRALLPSSKTLLDQLLVLYVAQFPLIYKYTFLVIGSIWDSQDCVWKLFGIQVPSGY